MAIPLAGDRDKVFQILSTLNSNISLDRITASVEELNKISADLARDATARYYQKLRQNRLLINIFRRRIVGQSVPVIWPELVELWRRISTHATLSLDSSSEGDLILAVARFTRNLVTADSFNQSHAL